MEASICGLLQPCRVVCVPNIIVVRQNHLPVLDRPYVRVMLFRCFHFFEAQGRKPIGFEKINKLRPMILSVFWILSLMLNWILANSDTSSIHATARWNVGREVHLKSLVHRHPTSKLWMAVSFVICVPNDQGSAERGIPREWDGGRVLIEAGSKTNHQ